MSYNPYAQEGNSEVKHNTRMHHPQPQHIPQQQYGNGNFQQQQQQQYQYQQQSQQFNQAAAAPPQQFGGNFLQDPRAAMTFQVGQNAMLAGSQFVEQNLNKYVSTHDIKYYFKVSNSYVFNKLLLILFPFKNKSWIRTYRSDSADSSNESYAFPLDDKNAPDLYIPLMGVVTYVLTLALISGLKNEFHPEVFGFKTSSTLAYLLLDFAVLKLGLYLLNINSKTWDLVSYIGYKFVPLILVIIIKNVSNFRVLNWMFYIYFILSFAFFELRAIRFNLFGGINNSSQNLNNQSLKNTNYFLFVYAFIFQSSLLWLLS